MTKTIGIAVAKARLFEIIDRVESGETIIIARNGAPVAQLRPLERESLEDGKRIPAVGQRIPKRNKAKQYSPLNGIEFSRYSPMIRSGSSAGGEGGNEPRSTM